MWFGRRTEQRSAQREMAAPDSSSHVRSLAKWGIPRSQSCLFRPSSTTNHAGSDTNPAVFCTANAQRHFRGTLHDLHWSDNCHTTTRVVPNQKDASSMSKIKFISISNLEPQTPAGMYVLPMLAREQNRTMRCLPRNKSPLCRDALPPACMSLLSANHCIANDECADVLH